MNYKLYKSNENSNWWIIKEDHYWGSVSNVWVRCQNVHVDLDKEPHLDFVSEFETEDCPYEYAKMLMLMES